MYYDSQEHTFKYFTNGQWGSVVWFSKAGIFLKEGAKAQGSVGNIFGKYRLGGFAKYEGGKVYARSQLLFESGKEACDSGWQEQGSDAECNFSGAQVLASADAYGVKVYLKVASSCPFHPKAPKEHEHLIVGEGHWR